MFVFSTQVNLVYQDMRGQNIGNSINSTNNGIRRLGPRLILIENWNPWGRRSSFDRVKSLCYLQLLQELPE